MGMLKAAPIAAAIGAILFIWLTSQYLQRQPVPETPPR